MKKKDEMILALAKELSLRKNEFAAETIDTIYFGGGTPSVLSTAEIEFLVNTVYQNYAVSRSPEITLEANPDDLSTEKISELANSKINRLSIGIQSFFEDDLKMMNRAHNSKEARIALEQATHSFDNISIDLIYGIPGMSEEKWKHNINTALSFGIPHISSYALTVEPRTALHKMIARGSIAAPNDEVSETHFHILAQTLETNGFVHYELSNFGKPGFFSRNNSAYWLGKKYLGMGPSAHSYDGLARSWNVSNNSHYLEAIANGELPSETEILSVTDKYNEYIMTGLRTIWGVGLKRIEDEFGSVYATYIKRQMPKYTDEGLLIVENGILKTTAKGKFLTDGIAADLFFTD
jgi:oxygen-independent coproporphyrinogen-3 oxidase